MIWGASFLAMRTESLLSPTDSPEKEHRQKVTRVTSARARWRRVISRATTKMTRRWRRGGASWSVGPPVGQPSGVEFSVGESQPHFFSPLVSVTRPCFAAVSRRLHSHAPPPSALRPSRVYERAACAAAGALCLCSHVVCPSTVPPSHLPFLRPPFFQASSPWTPSPPPPSPSPPPPPPRRVRYLRPATYIVHSSRVPASRRNTGKHIRPPPNCQTSSPGCAYPPPSSSCAAPALAPRPLRPVPVRRVWVGWRRGGASRLVGPGGEASGVTFGHQTFHKNEYTRPAPAMPPGLCHSSRRLHAYPPPAYARRPSRVEERAASTAASALCQQVVCPSTLPPSHLPVLHPSCFQASSAPSPP